MTTETRTIAPSFPDYAPVPQSALGPALNDQGYYAGRVERNFYWITDGTYQSAAADAFTESTTFWVIESIRLDLGHGSEVHP